MAVIQGNVRLRCHPEECQAEFIEALSKGSKPNRKMNRQQNAYISTMLRHAELAEAWRSVTLLNMTFCVIIVLT